jgi:SAM-dependent methyltransferase
MVASPPGKQQRHAPPRRSALRLALRRLSQTFVHRAPGERDDCPACGSSEIVNIDVLSLRAARTGFACVCDDCGLVFSNPIPTPDDLAHFYSPSGAWGNERRDLPDVPSHAASRVGGLWTQMFDPIRGEIDVASPPPGATVLDFGCGEGRLLDLLQNCGWQTCGIEPALDRAFQRHRRLDAIPRAAEFDLVVLLQVLEHVANPLDLLRQLAGACRVGGHLLVSVPRFDTLPLHRDYKYVLNGRAHITAYTWACLQELLSRAGWQAVAPPPAEVGKGGGGRRTTSRLRVLARRVDDVAEHAASGVARPGDEARVALRAYYAGTSRPLLARAGLIRLAALQAHLWRLYSARKTPKPDAASRSTAV